MHARLPRATRACAHARAPRPAPRPGAGPEGASAAAAAAAELAAGTGPGSAVVSAVVSALLDDLNTPAAVSELSAPLKTINDLLTTKAGKKQPGRLTVRISKGGGGRRGRTWG